MLVTCRAEDAGPWGGSVRERRGRTDGERRAWGGWLNTCYRLVFGGGEAGSASGLESRQHACTPSTLEGYQCSIACLASAPLTVVASCSAPWPAPASGRDGTLLLLLLPLPLLLAAATARASPGAKGGRCCELVVVAWLRPHRATEPSRASSPQVRCGKSLSWYGRSAVGEEREGSARCKQACATASERESAE